MDTAFKAMEFAAEAHRTQLRKYTHTPYVEHLAEVAGIVSTVTDYAEAVVPARVMIAVAWLHDTVGDTPTELDTLHAMFGSMVSRGVGMLTDTPVRPGENRAHRKAADRLRLSRAEGWIQTIKVADLISNSKSIMQFDAKFGALYLEEKRLLLEVLKDADPRLVTIAKEYTA